MTIKQDEYAVFILSHGRADRVLTYKRLRHQNYTGKIYVIVDNEDESIERYREHYGDQVIVFDKAAIDRISDKGDNFPGRRSTIYPRNAFFQIARKLGLTYFIQLDDDYNAFTGRFTPKLHYRSQIIYDLDQLFKIYLTFLRDTPVTCIAMAQRGDFIGGTGGSMGAKLWLKRKVMNSFFCHVDRPFQFFGRLNEDVNTYVLGGWQGKLFVTFNGCDINQTETQSQAGGMTEAYLDFGTYVKSFYTVMYAPSCVKISMMGPVYRRIHHRINWEQTTPKILRESVRKS